MGIGKDEAEVLAVLLKVLQGRFQGDPIAFLIPRGQFGIAFEEEFESELVGGNQCPAIVLAVVGIGAWLIFPAVPLLLVLRLVLLWRGRSVQQPGIVLSMLQKVYRGGSDRPLS